MQGEGLSHHYWKSLKRHWEIDEKSESFTTLKPKAIFGKIREPLKVFEMVNNPQLAQWAFPSGETEDAASNQ